MKFESHTRTHQHTYHNSAHAQKRSTWTNARRTHIFQCKLRGFHCIKRSVSADVRLSAPDIFRNFQSVPFILRPIECVVPKPLLLTCVSPGVGVCVCACACLFVWMLRKTFLLRAFMFWVVFRSNYYTTTTLHTHTYATLHTKTHCIWCVRSSECVYVCVCVCMLECVTETIEPCRASANTYTCTHSTRYVYIISTKAYDARCALCSSVDRMWKILFMPLVHTPGQPGLTCLIEIGLYKIDKISV